MYSDRPPLCKIDVWSSNAILMDPKYRGLLIVLGCRKYNQSHFDLAAWVILEHEAEYHRGRNLELYNNLSESSFKLGGLTNLHPVKLLSGMVYQNVSPIDSRTDCYVNSCVKEKREKFNYFNIIWTVFGLLVVTCDINIFNSKIYLNKSTCIVGP